MAGGWRLGVCAPPPPMEVFVEWHTHAPQALAVFRAAPRGVRNDRVMTELIDIVSAESDEFAKWWSEHDVASFESRLRRFNHPYAGVLTFEYQLLVPAEWPDLRVVTQLPVPGDDSADRLAVRHPLV